MTSPSEELQGAIYRSLTADSGVMALIGGVFDRVQRANDGSPISSVWGDQQGYVSFGPEDTVYSSVECVDMERVTIQLDAWSRQVGRVHCKRIMAEVRRVLDGLDSLTDNALSLADVPQSRLMLDADGLTQHGVLTATFLVERVSPAQT
jgi:hypothetical protein